jgi:hypothetical protein
LPGGSIDVAGRADEADAVDLADGVAPAGHGA